MQERNSDDSSDINESDIEVISQPQPVYQGGAPINLYGDREETPMANTPEPMPIGPQQHGYTRPPPNLPFVLPEQINAMEHVDEPRHPAAMEDIEDASSADFSYAAEDNLDANLERPRRSRSRERRPFGRPAAHPPRPSSPSLERWEPQSSPPREQAPPDYVENTAEYIAEKTNKEMQNEVSFEIAAIDE